MIWPAVAGLGIAVGTGGVFALLLAVRRQWHQELSAAATDHDAAERRVTELYTKAVEQLGSPQAPVRLGGLYALERVAQNNPDQRQTVVNVLCAYLRMPYTPPSTSPRRLGIHRSPRPPHARRDTTQTPAHSTNNNDATREELEVRLAAQRILAKHLNVEPTPMTPRDTFWKDMDLDLTRATLVDWNLRRCRVHNATFNEAQFTGTAGFGGTQFTGEAWFFGAKFTGEAWFGAHFTGIAIFNRAQFTRDASFSGARFIDLARFAGVQFTGEVEFDGVQFAGDAVFNGTWFTGDTSFDGAQFTGKAQFDGTRFERGVPAAIAALLPEPAARDDAVDSAEPWLVGTFWNDEGHTTGNTG